MSSIQHSRRPAGISRSVMALLGLCLLLPSAWTEEADEDQDGEPDIELVAWDTLHKTFQPYRPSLITRAKQWAEDHPKLKSQIHRHLSEVHQHLLEELEEDEDEDDEDERDEREDEDHDDDKDSDEDGERDDDDDDHAELVQHLTVVEMEMAVSISGHRLRNGKQAEQASLRKQLRTDLNALFDAKIAQRRHELTELEDEMQELKDQLQRAEAQRDSIIEARMARYQNGPDVFDW